MVRIEAIEEIINNLINHNEFKEDIDVKCGPSRKTIESKLASMSEDEKIEGLNELYDNGLLSDNEVDLWTNLSDKYDKVKDKDLSKFPEHIQNEIESIKEALYHIEKRIITHEKSPLAEVDLEIFQEAEQITDRDFTSDLEQRQIDAQNENLKNVDWDLYGDGTDFYGYGGYWHMNGVLVNGEDEYFNNLVKEGNISSDEITYWKNKVHNEINHLNYLMDNSGGLLEDTVLYRGGVFPTNLVPGMKGKFPCFSSTSYNKDIADSFQVEGKEYMIKIYAPKGTRGLSSGGSMYDGNSSIGSPKEHEFTLGAGQKFIVLDRNDKDMSVEILLLN